MDTTVLVRTTTDAAALKDLARREAYAVEPVLRLFVKTFEEKSPHSRQLCLPRVTRSDCARHSGSHAGSDWALWRDGVVGGPTHAKSEFAWHSEPATNVLALVLRHGMKLVLIGAIIGIPASLAAGRLLSSMLVGLTTSDALTIGVVTALLIGVTLLACYLPARRATRVDPLETLRYE